MADPRTASATPQHAPSSLPAAPTTTTLDFFTRVWEIAGRYVRRNEPCALPGCAEGGAA